MLEVAVEETFTSGEIYPYSEGRRLFYIGILDVKGQKFHGFLELTENVFRSGNVVTIPIGVKPGEKSNTPYQERNLSLLERPIMWANYDLIKNLPLHLFSALREGRITPMEERLSREEIFSAVRNLTIRPEKRIRSNSYN